MSDEWNLSHIIAPGLPSEWAYDLSYTVSALIRTARLALDNDTDAKGGASMEGRAAVANTLEVAYALMAVVIDGSEDMSRRLNTGMFKKDAQMFPESPASSQG